MELSKQDSEKKLAAEKAAEYIEDGMTVGLGSGSTVVFAVKKIGEMVRNGLKINAVSTSDSTTRLAQREGINLISLDESVRLDLTIDGADEVQRDTLNGIKGGGGALLFEKIVALSSDRNIWIVDSGKLVDTLGKFPLPVEVVPFGYKRVFKIIEDRGLMPVQRQKDGEVYFTDSGNFIFDLHNTMNEDPVSLNTELKLIIGVIETGYFIGIAGEVIIARDNITQTLNKKK